jgi:hypothetical protein
VIISRLNLEPLMPRPHDRFCLQDGLKLDFNRLARRGFIQHGANIGVRGITWTHSYWGEIASGLISADMSGNGEGWLLIQLRNLDKWTTLVFEPSSYGNHPAQPALVGKLGVSIPIQRRHKSGSRWKSADQVTLITNLHPGEWDCRPNRSGCEGRLTIARSSDTTDMRIS